MEKSKIKKLELKRLESDNDLLDNELRCATESELSEERSMYIGHINGQIFNNQEEIKQINRNKTSLVKFVNSLFKTFKFLEDKNDNKKL